METIECDPNGIDQHQPGAKLDDGKLKAGVLIDFSRALRAIAIVGDFGARKYTRKGWVSVENGEERYFDAMWRHLLAEGRGEVIDLDSNLPHFYHFAWNVLAILELRIKGEKEENLK